VSNSCEAKRLQTVSRLTTTTKHLTYPAIILQYIEPATSQS